MKRAGKFDAKRSGHVVKVDHPGESVTRRDPDPQSFCRCAKDRPSTCWVPAFAAAEQAAAQFAAIRSIQLLSHDDGQSLSRSGAEILLTIGLERHAVRCLRRALRLQQFIGERLKTQRQVFTVRQSQQRLAGVPRLRSHEGH